LGGWLPRPWGRWKSTRPDLPAPEPRRMDSSSENSGSDWDSAPETMGDLGPPKTKDSGAQRSSGAAPEPSRESQVEQPGCKGMDSLKWDKTVSSTQESGRLEAGETIPKLGWDPVDSGSTRKPGVSPEEGLSPPGPEAPAEKPGQRQKLLDWLRGETGGGAGAPYQYLGDPEECLQISTNLTLHLLELLASALLGLLLTAHPLHFACLFGLLQALVLAVSLREPSGDGEATDLEGEKLGREGEEQRGDPGKRL
ncbi:hypothetical protein E2I00_009854, partial [Balaenoptera physalus]